MSQETCISGREPRLSPSYARQGKRLLSLTRLASMLEVLPPSAVSLDVAMEALRSDSFYVRLGAAKILNKRGDRAARMVMQTILNEGNVPSRATVARHLYGFSWIAIEPLVNQALQDNDPRVREGAIYALCDARELNAFQTMARVLQTEVDSVRGAAAWGLRECQDPAAIPVFEAVMLAEDPEVRIKALEVLGSNSMAQVLPILRKALHDIDPDVQYAATLSLLEVAGEACLAELAELIQHSSGQTRQAILRGLFHACNYLKISIESSSVVDAVVDALEAAIGDASPQVREAAIWPLAWMRHERSVSVLEQAYLRETHQDTQIQFMRVTSSLMSEAAEGILHTAICSHDTDIRTLAEQLTAARI